MPSPFDSHSQQQDQQGSSTTGTQKRPATTPLFNFTSEGPPQPQPQSSVQSTTFSWTHPQQWPTFAFPTQSAATGQFAGGSSIRPAVFVQNPFSIPAAARIPQSIFGSPLPRFTFPSSSQGPTMTKTSFPTVYPSSSNIPVTHAASTVFPLPDFFSFGSPTIPTFPVDLEEVNPTAVAPVPPDWKISYDAATRASTIYTKIQVQQSTNEYKTLTELVHSSPNLEVTGIERVINCGLWKKFLIAREELLSLKSSDVKLLTELGFTYYEARNQAFEFSKFNSSAGIPSFSDNMALLFHCTRGNVDSILKQGLDDRFAKRSGILGSGIYFADNPGKAAKYDTNNVLIVCAVLLGDCLQEPALHGHLREPEKADGQKRSKDDQFFSSIVGHPYKDNEYVIFDRRQCIPLYLIHYNKTNRPASESVLGQMYAEARNHFPSFSWLPQFQAPFSHVLLQSEARRWPFFAQTIFNRMAEPGNTSKQPNSVPDLLARLRDLGFLDDKINTQKLIENNYDIDRTVKALSAVTSTPAQTTAKVYSNTTDPECCICYDEATQWTSFSCSHRVCSDCFGQIRKQGSTMSGQNHTYAKCPLCKREDGLKLGTCPDGVMSPTISKTSLPGYEGYNTIEIAYIISDINQRKIAFLPDCPEGRYALELLKIAWDRRLVFSFEPSETPGQPNKLIWNIYHKTERNTFPDQDYLGDLLDDLEEYDIKIE